MSSNRAAALDSRKMECISCREEYGPVDAGTCKECYEEASETEEELKREIEELKDKVSFLRFSSPLSSSCFADVVLVASDDPRDKALPHRPHVPAHKAILASKSPVFKAMLENEMMESRSGTIKICDVSYDALRSFVQYLYTAEVHLDELMACDLLVLGEKYQVKHLKSHCENFLTSKLSVENALMCFAFSSQHSAKSLHEASLSVITEKMDKLTKQEEYLELVEKDPRLVVAIYEAYLAKQLNTAVIKD